VEPGLDDVLAAGGGRPSPLSRGSSHLGHI
jgi:hypothetical protein